MEKEELNKIISEALFPYWNCICNNADYPEIILSKAAEKISKEIWEKLKGPLNELEIKKRIL